MVSTGLEATVVVAAAAPTGVVCALSMLAVPVVTTVPVASGVATLTTILNQPDAPAARVPMLQVTTAPDGVPPPVAETKVVFAGSVSVTTTPVALPVPVLPPVIV